MLGKASSPFQRNFPRNWRFLADPTAKISSTGSLSDFLKYFQDRFVRIERLLRERLDVRDTVSIKDALNSPSNTKVKVIGMVTGIRERERAIFIQIEDFDAVATVLVSSKAKGSVREKAQTILLDQVVCVEGMKGSGDLSQPQPSLTQTEPILTSARQ